MAFKNYFHVYTKSPVSAGDQLLPNDGDFSEYEKGAKAGDPLSSQIMNTAVKTGSLVAVALIEALTKSQTIPSLGVHNTYIEVRDFIKEGLYNTKVKVAEYADDDTSKGTIEQRLTNLGFKEGHINGSMFSNVTLTREGNRCILSTNFVASNATGFTAQIADAYCYPKKQFSAISEVTIHYPYGSDSTVEVVITFNTNGSITCTGTPAPEHPTVGTHYLYLGWECNPITSNEGD